MDENKSYQLAPTNGRPVRFMGRRVAMWEEDYYHESQHHHTIELYETQGGNYVIYRTIFSFGHRKDSVEVAKSPRDLFKALGFHAAAMKIYDRLGIDPALEIE